MAYLLDSTTIRSPNNIDEETVDQFAQHKTLDGAVRRDYFGDTKRIWMFDYVNTNPTDLSTIKTIVDAYKSTGTTKTFESTETNYTIAETSVHLSLTKRVFRVKGTDYLSDFTLVMAEA